MECHLLKAGSEGASSPQSGRQDPLAVGTPRPSVDPAYRTAHSYTFPAVYYDVATLGSVKPHKGVGFQPNEALHYRGSRHTTYASAGSGTSLGDSSIQAATFFVFLAAATGAGVVAANFNAGTNEGSGVGAT